MVGAVSAPITTPLPTRTAGAFFFKHPTVTVTAGVSVSGDLSSLACMAFRTRVGQTVAIGHGTMTATLCTWWGATALLIAPIGLVVTGAVWATVSSSRASLEEVLPPLYELSRTSLLMSFLMMLSLALVPAFAFAGPDNSDRDRWMMVIRSTTARWCVLSGALAFGLLMAIQGPFLKRWLLALILAALLTTSTLRAGILLTLVYRRNREAPYLEGMSEEEKRKSEQNRAARKRPSFPEVSTVGCPDDARRYSRRAAAISNIHTWAGAGVIVVFSAFVGSSLSTLVESGDSWALIPVYLVLGALALGFWIQRRADQYAALHAEFEARASELEEATRRSSIADRLLSRIGILRLPRPALRNASANSIRPAATDRALIPNVRQTRKIRSRELVAKI